MKAMLALSVLLLVACTAAPVFYFQGGITMSDYKTALAVLSLAYFVVATLYATRRKS